MTAYNREMYIDEAIQSVLSSTYENFELIIVDDCSKDRTQEIIKRYAESDSRIRFFINEKNLGDYPNRNKAASYARGKYIMSVDSDDSINSDAMAYVVNCFKQFPSAHFGILYYGPDIHQPTLVKRENALRRHFFERRFLNIGPGGTVIERDFFIKIGGFPEAYGPANDMFYNLKVACNTGVILMHNIYLNYRIHDGQEKNNWFKYLCFNYLTVRDAMALPELTLNPDEKRKVIVNNTRSNFRSILSYIKHTGEVRKAWKAFRISGLKLTNLI